MLAPTFISRTRLKFDWEEYPDPPEAAFRLARMEAHFINRAGFIRRAKFIAQRDMVQKFEEERDPQGNKWKELVHPAVGQVGILQLTTKMRDAAVDYGTYDVRPDGLWFDTTKLPEYWIFHEQPQGAIGERLPRRSFIPLTDRAKGQITALFSQWVDEGVVLGARGKVAVGRSPIGLFEPLQAV